MPGRVGEVKWRSRRCLFTRLTVLMHQGCSQETFVTREDASRREHCPVFPPGLSWQTNWFLFTGYGKGIEGRLI